mgnify:CR=1 FL=1
MKDAIAAADFLKRPYVDYQTLMNLPLEVIVGMGTKVWSYIDNTVKLVIFITAPFNILKGAVLSVVTYLLYKRVSPLLHQKSAR